MKTFTKKNVVVIVVTCILMGLGNVITNICILLKNGYKWNKETKQFEKSCFVDITTKFQIENSNTVWRIVGTIVGLIVGTVIRMNNKKEG